MKWKPIETAPTFGKAFLIHCAERKNTYIVIARSGTLFHFATGSYELNEKPTHWMPLPAAPDATDEEGKG